MVSISAFQSQFCFQSPLLGSHLVLVSAFSLVLGFRHLSILRTHRRLRFQTVSLLPPGGSLLHLQQEDQEFLLTLLSE